MPDNMAGVEWGTANGDRVRVYPAEDGWRYHVRARNGEIVEQSSEAYTRTESAVYAAQRYHPETESILRQVAFGPRTAKFVDHPCELYGYHWPVPLRTQFHHSRPVFLQNKLYGRIMHPADFWVCGTCHDSLHVTIDWLLGEGQHPNQSIGRFVLRKANETVAWYQSELTRLGREQMET